jgi:murein DD-endopeptidase MepM/ murein hydrolase activator NlpD
VQHLFSLLYDANEWQEAVSENGLFSVYSSFFGYPFDYAIEPLIPPDLTQPTFQLPFELGISWIFSGGPHGGWDDGSAWAALDFVPPSEDYGCFISDEWAVAIADGLIVRSEYGLVVQDVDGDGLWQTGWSILYMHIRTDGRIQEGVYVSAGDRIGHPSCEGGYATATHLHIARRYNGEWISSDGSVPFVMDGWVPVSTGSAYDGYLQRGEQTIEACECREPQNMIQR